MPESWLNIFESRLEQLERAARGDSADIPEIIRYAELSIAGLAADADVRVLLVQQADARSRIAGSDVSESTSERLWTEQLTADGRMEQVELPDEPAVAQAIHSGHFLTAASGPERQTLLVSRRVGSDHWCVLRIEFQSTAAGQREFVDGAQAVHEILTGSVTQHLLARYDERLQTQASLVAFLTRLHQSNTAKEAAGVIAQDCPPFLRSSRVSVLIDRGGQFVVEAVTGVQEPLQDAETVRAIREISVGEATEDWKAAASADHQVSSVTAVLTQQGLQQFRVLQIRETAEGIPSALVTIELHAADEMPEEYLVQQIKTAAQSILCPLQRRERTIAQRLIRSRRLRWLLAAAAILLLLTCWPTRFEVEVPGQISSSNHRRIFAPEHGIVDDVLFSNEQSVEKLTPLLNLSNADITLELRRINGEIATKDAELTTAQAEVLAGNNPDASANEQRLQQQLANLNKERTLVRERAASLLIRAPFSGRVFRHNARQDLKQRPVQRGQLLFDIVPKDEQWHLELSIPDDLETYVRGYIQQHSRMPSVRYFVRASPDQFRTVSLSRLDDAVQIVDGKMICHAQAELGDFPLAEVRPGTSVTARIACGKRPLGFVWFREVIELWRRFQFAWL